MEKQLSEMGKQQLRAACKTAGVKNYGKMTVEGMRTALAALTRTHNQPETAVTAKAPPAGVVKDESADAPRARGVQCYRRRERVAIWAV